MPDTSYMPPEEAESRMDAAVANGNAADGWNAEFEPAVWTEIMGERESPATEATRQVLIQAQAQRLPPPEFIVCGVDDQRPRDPLRDMMDVLTSGRSDPGRIEVIGGSGNPRVTGHSATVLGADEIDYGFGGAEILDSGEVAGGDPGMFVSPDAELEFPVLATIYRGYTEIADPPQIVRVDTDASYRDFVTRKAFDELVDRVSELRAAMDAHAADGHGAGFGFSSWDEVLGMAESTKAAKRAAEAGMHPNEIPLSLDPECDGNVKCWEEGGKIVCSMRVEGPDGSPRVLTAATPTALHEFEVAEYMRDAGVDPVDLVGVLPMLVRMMGGGSLVPRLATAMPALMDDHDVKAGRVVARKIVPTNDASTATLMDLAQRAQAGDGQAEAEWRKLHALSQRPGAAALAAAMDNAARRLATGQAAKAAVH